MHKFTIMNASACKLFSSSLYKPVFRMVPYSTEWQRISQPTTFVQTFVNNYRYSFAFDCPCSDNEVFFALAPPYSYDNLVKTLDLYESLTPPDTVFYREVLSKTIDNRDVELLTISAKKNFSTEREERKVGTFPTTYPRCFRSTKPIIFISARVHPGETPASFMLDSILQILLSKDPRAIVLRNQFVFKIIPMLNPDGVARGHFRVDQNGINLNRCYAFPNFLDQPSIFAVKEYVESVIFSNICFYLDLHAHASKKSCFVFGNSLENARAQEIEVFAKLLELNSQYFDYQDSDFSEKSMKAKDPKDHHSKEGSGRVAFYKSIDLTHSYTIESSYYIPKPLHLIPPMVNMKTGKRTPEFLYSEKYLIHIYNRPMFVDIAFGLFSAILDSFKMNPFSRLPATEYKNIENLKEVINNFRRLRKIKTRKSNSKADLNRITDKITESGLKTKLPVLIQGYSERPSDAAKPLPSRNKPSIKFSLRPKTII